MCPVASKVSFQRRQEQRYYRFSLVFLVSCSTCVNLRPVEIWDPPIPISTISLQLSFHSCTREHGWRKGVQGVAKAPLDFEIGDFPINPLLRIAAVWDTKQAGDLSGYTVQLIASTSALLLMTQNGNIYRPLKKQRLVLYHDTERNIAENS